MLYFLSLLLAAYHNVDEACSEVGWVPLVETKLRSMNDFSINEKITWSNSPKDNHRFRQ